MLRTLSIMVVAGVLLAVSAGAAAAPGDGVWVNGARHGLVTGPPAGTSATPSALYVIAPVVRARPMHPLAEARTHGFGAHDHVLAPRTRAAGTCDLELVVPGPKARLGRNVLARPTQTPVGTRPLLYSVRLGSGQEPLTWASRIRRATALGLARVVDTHTLIGCTVS